MHRSLVSYDDFLPVIINIDERSLAELGQWPWPRYHIAKILNNLHKAGAASIDVDILLSEPDRTSLKVIQKGNLSLRHRYFLKEKSIVQGLP
ncbi:MAG: adenylate cyclase [Desulforhopalus sp.]|jgi:adenylate cyclase